MNGKKKDFLIIFSLVICATASQYVDKFLESSEKEEAATTALPPDLDRECSAPEENDGENTDTSALKLAQIKVKVAGENVPVEDKSKMVVGAPIVTSKEKNKQRYSSSFSVQRKTFTQRRSSNLKDVACLGPQQTAVVKRNRVSKKQQMKERNIEEIGTWVQCDRTSCMKWRYLADVHDPAELPQKWTCSMNDNEAFNSCDAPEEEWDETEHIFTKFTEGSVVWARLPGFPYWPALVEIDPDYNTFFECTNKEHRNVVTRYHVVFFDDKVSRAWVQSSHLKPFTNTDCVGTTVAKGHNYKKAINVAKVKARKALEMPIRERLRTYSFAERYKGRWCNLPQGAAECAKRKGKRKRESGEAHHVMQFDDFEYDEEVFYDEAEEIIRSAESVLDEFLSNHSQQSGGSNYSFGSPPKKKAKKNKDKAEKSTQSKNKTSRGENSAKIKSATMTRDDEAKATTNPKLERKPSDGDGVAESTIQKAPRNDDSSTEKTGADAQNMGDSLANSEKSVIESSKEIPHVAADGENVTSQGEGAKNLVVTEAESTSECCETGRKANKEMMRDIETSKEDVGTPSKEFDRTAEEVSGENETPGKPAKTRKCMGNTPKKITPAKQTFIANAPAPARKPTKAAPAKPKQPKPHVKKPDFDSKKTDAVTRTCEQGIVSSTAEEETYKKGSQGPQSGKGGKTCGGNHENVAAKKPVFSRPENKDENGTKPKKPTFGIPKKKTLGIKAVVSKKVAGPDLGTEKSTDCGQDVSEHELKAQAMDMGLVEGNQRSDNAGNTSPCASSVLAKKLRKKLENPSSFSKETDFENVDGDDDKMVPKAQKCSEEKDASLSVNAAQSYIKEASKSVVNSQGSDAFDFELDGKNEKIPPLAPVGAAESQPVVSTIGQRNDDDSDFDFEE